MARAIPLSSPDGAVYAYACGVCHHVRVGGTHMGRTGKGPDKIEVESSKRDAVGCCSCRSCGRVKRGLLDECARCEKKRADERAAGEPARRAAAERERAAFDAALAKAADRDAALRLRSMLSDLSEEIICSSWDEFEIGCCWEAVCGDESHLGGRERAELSPPVVAELRRLFLKAGGWWTYEAFVPATEWTATHGALS